VCLKEYKEKGNHELFKLVDEKYYGIVHVLSVESIKSYKGVLSQIPVILPRCERLLNLRLKLDSIKMLVGCINLLPLEVQHLDVFYFNKKKWDVSEIQINVKPGQSLKTLSFSCDRPIFKSMHPELNPSWRWSSTIPYDESRRSLESHKNQDLYHKMKARSRKVQMNSVIIKLLQSIIQSSSGTIEHLKLKSIDISLLLVPSIQFTKLEILEFDSFSMSNLHKLSIPSNRRLHGIKIPVFIMMDSMGHSIYCTDVMERIGFIWRRLDVEDFLQIYAKMQYFV
jgi:hypothetical protein